MSGAFSSSMFLLRRMDIYGVGKRVEMRASTPSPPPWFNDLSS
ncbi:hypothetical protein HMPREF0972_02348 [Actinomyces sp. oral taxon 848 str. F0332]|nr:hypothetical protein HMPREF0972_02348 [Actinomyces sp. oral taxon 848 str. F0332]